MEFHPGKGEASQAPGTSPTLPQPAPSRARTLEAGECSRVTVPPSFVSFFVFYIFSYLLLKTWVAFLGA